MGDVKIKNKNDDETTLEISGDFLECAKDLARHAYMSSSSDEGAILLLTAAAEIIVQTSKPKDEISGQRRGKKK